MVLLRENIRYLMYLLVELAYSSVMSMRHTSERTRSLLDDIPNRKPHIAIQAFKSYIFLIDIRHQRLHSWCAISYLLA